MFLNCVNITFHTSKQEPTLPTFKTGLLPTHEALVNSIHTSRTNHLALHWAPEGVASQGEWQPPWGAEVRPGPASWLAFREKQAGEPG